MKRNLILLLIGILIAAFFFWDQNRTEKQKQKEEKEKEIFTLTKNDVKEVTVVKKDGRFKAIKEGDSWKLVEPFETSGDKNNWDGVVGSLVEGKKQRVIEKDAKDWKPYGLDAPPLQVTLSGVGGATASTILFGKQTPTSGKYYAAIAGGSDVITVFSAMYTSADKNLFDWRDKSILTFDADKVQRMEVDCGTISVTLQRRGEDNWVITKPISALADATKIRDFLNKVKNARIKQFIDEKPATLAAYGLVQSATKLVFWNGDPVNESTWAASALLFGSTSVAEQWYAKRESQPNVFAVDPKDFNTIPTNVDALRSKKIASLRSWELTQFSVASADAVILEASKNVGEWQILQPKAKPAEYTTVSNLLRNIADLEAANFVPGTTEQYGLASPSLKFVLKTEKGSETVALAAPKSATEPGRYYYGARTNPLEIYAIPEEKIKEIMDSVNKLTAEPAPTPAVAPPPSAATGAPSGALPIVATPAVIQGATQ